jgi:hypothetical protein
MATFTPPQDLVCPSWTVDTPRWVRRAFRSATGPPRARTVFLYDEDTKVIEGAMPPAEYDEDGNLVTLAEDRISAVFYGAMGPYPVTAAQQATLEAAGYTVDA